MFNWQIEGSGRLFSTFDSAWLFFPIFYQNLAISLALMDTIFLIPFENLSFVWNKIFEDLTHKIQTYWAWNVSKMRLTQARISLKGNLEIVVLTTELDSCKFKKVNCGVPINWTILNNFSWLSKFLVHMFFFLCSILMKNTIPSEQTKMAIWSKKLSGVVDKNVNNCHTFWS